MDSEPARQTPERKPSLPSLTRWLAWGFAILLGASVVMMLVGIGLSVAKDGWHSRKLPFFMFAVIFVIGFFGLKAATHPIRGRRDERRAWKERFAAAPFGHSQMVEVEHVRLHRSERSPTFGKSVLFSAILNIVFATAAVVANLGWQFLQFRQQPGHQLFRVRRHSIHLCS